MATQLFADNTAATLASAISDSALSMTLTAGQGAQFPTPTGGDFFELTLIDRMNAVEIGWEIVAVTARVGDVLTIARRAGARAWSAGASLQIRWTSSSIARLRTEIASAGASAVKQLFYASF